MRRLSLLAAGVLAATVGLLGGQQASADPGGGMVRAAAVYSCWWVQSDALCATPLTNLNIRAHPWSTAGYITTMPRGSDFWLHCWNWGESVNGDTVWYYGTWDIGGDDPREWPTGWSAGYYLSTGHDPNPQVPNCGFN